MEYFFLFPEQIKAPDQTEPEPQEPNPEPPAPSPRQAEASQRGHHPIEATSQPNTKPPIETGARPVVCLIRGLNPIITYSIVDYVMEVKKEVNKKD